MLKKRIAQAALAVMSILLFAAGCGQSKSGDTGGEADKGKQDPIAVEIVTALSQPFEITVQAQGTLAPGQGASAKVASPTAGRLRTVNVREGDHVHAGQVLAVVDNRPQQAQANSAAAALRTSQAQEREAILAARAAAVDQTNAVHQARLALIAAQQDRESAVQQAQTALQTAQSDLDKTLKGARPQEIAQADLAVQQAQATRSRAATELDRVHFLYQKGIDAKRQLDDAQTALDVADAALKTAQSQADLLRAGARPEDRRAAELRVQQAREMLSQAQTSGTAHVAQAQAALRLAQQSALQVAVKQQDAQAFQQTVAQKQADLLSAQATAHYAELHAPIRGVVTRRALNPGDMADPTTPVLEISQVRSLDVLANLPAADGMQVRAGMPVHIQASDLPGQTFAGRVLSVGQVDPQTNLLAVRIAVDNAQGRLKSGAFVTADIVIRTDPHAVVVPKQTVVTQDGKAVVFTVGADDTAHKQEVTVGAEQGDRLEILHGLAAGDKVVRLGQYELTDGAKIKPAEKTAEAKAGGAEADTP